MISPNRRRLGGFVLAVALLPNLARAQTMARSFEELQGILKAEEIVVVMDQTGQETLGRVAKVSTSALVLFIPEKTSGGQELYTTGAKRTFTEDSVAEITRSDLSGRKGTRIYLALARSFQDLQRTLKVGQTVVVTDESGRQTKGKVADVSAASLVLLTPEAKRTFAEATVTQVKRTDPLWDGTLIGMAIGFAVPAAILFSLAQPHTSAGEIMSVLFLPTEVGCCWGLLGAGIGAAAGAGIDAMRVGRTTVYVSPRKTSGVTIAPLLGKDRQGALVSVRF